MQQQNNTAASLRKDHSSATMDTLQHHALAQSGTFPKKGKKSLKTHTFNLAFT